MTSYLLTAFVFVVILTLLVFVHELGHFMLARRAGMKVEEFGIGLPPKMYSWHKFGTEVSLNAIPIGGFVRVKGGDTMTITKKELQDKENYHSKSLLQRFLFIVAGVVMNFLLAFILLTIGYLIGMTPLPGTDLFDKNQEFQGVLVSEVEELAPADQSGLKPNDLIIKVDNMPLENHVDFSAYIKEHKGIMITLEYSRNNITKTSKVVPDENGFIGIKMVPMITLNEVRLNILDAIYYAFQNTFFVSVETFKGIFGVFASILTKFYVPSEVSGPVGIVNITHQVIQVGFKSLLQFTAILSISLAVINIIPFPALDGGRLVFLLVEGVSGRKVNANLEGTTHLIGFILLMLLFVAVTYKDLVAIFF